MSRRGVFFLALVLCAVARAEAPSLNLQLNSLQPMQNVKAADSLDGKVFVYFWASWCPACREKLPSAIPALQTEFPKIKVITVDMDHELSQGKSYAESEKLTVPIYRDDPAAPSLAKSLKLFALPAWAVLEKNKDGTWSKQKSAIGSDLDEIKSALKN